MSTVVRQNRKGSDEEIVRANRLGRSLSSIASDIGCHPSSITLRLKGLNITPSDTRRAFMDDIYKTMTEEQIEALADHLDVSEMTVKEYVAKLIKDDHLRRTHNQINLEGHVAGHA